MTDQQGEPKRVLEAEALLARASFREPDWDAFAERVEGALASAGPSDDSLLLPPLPESVEDGRLEVRAAPAESVEPASGTAGAASEEDALPASARESTSLAELARAAVARRGARDAVSLAKESFAIASQKRAAVEAVPTPAVTASPAGTAEARNVVERERKTLPPARRGRPALDTRGPWLGVAVAALGLAAGFGLYLSGRSRTEIVEVPVVVAPTAAPAPIAAVAKAPAAAEHSTPAPEVTPDMLPAERSARAAAPEAVAAEAIAPEGAPAKSSAVAAARPTPSAARAPGAGSANPARAEKIVLEEDHAGSAVAAAPPSRPGTTPGLKPAELNANGGVPDRPSTGAAQAAVGAVLGAARSCLAGQPQGSSATLVFGSNGEVSSVSVNGPAAGTPAASCIQTALKKARVQPFAAPSFSLGVTVRPP
jgi:hypothetical protein